MVIEMLKSAIYHFCIFQYLLPSSSYNSIYIGKVHRKTADETACNSDSDCTSLYLPWLPLAMRHTHTHTYIYMVLILFVSHHTGQTRQVQTSADAIAVVVSFECCFALLFARVNESLANLQMKVHAGKFCFSPLNISFLV